MDDADDHAPLSAVYNTTGASLFHCERFGTGSSLY